MGSIQTIIHFLFPIEPKFIFLIQTRYDSSRVCQTKRVLFSSPLPKLLFVGAAGGRQTHLQETLKRQ